MSANVTISREKRNKSSPHVVRWDSDEINPNGKAKRPCKSFRTRAEARQFAAKKRTEIAEGKDVDKPKDVTLDSYCKNWLRVRQSELRPASLECYINTFGRLKDFFGKDCKLRNIDTPRARLFIAEQKNQTDPNKKLSDASREQIKRNCKCFFNTAVEDGVLIKNPFGPVKAKKLEKKRWYRLKFDEYYRLLDAAPDLRTKVSYALLYTAGLRLSEAYSLIWSDIDFENGRVIIDNRDGTANIPPFKVKDHEKRRIPLPDDVVDLLTEWQTKAPEGVPYVLLTKERYELVKKKWQKLAKERKAWRNRYLVNNVLRNFKNHYKRAGIKPVGKFTIHTLRKACGQNWADELPMNVVKELMGHSNIATTAEYYNQVDPDHEAKAASVIQQQLKQAKERYVLDTYEPILAEKGVK